MNFRSIFLVLLVASFSHVGAQDVKFGKIDEEDFVSTSYAQDSSAVAVVLHREFNSGFEYIESKGFHLRTYVFERVKILKKEGYEYATVRENLYKNSAGRETLNGLKGYTYNLVDGTIEKEKLKRSDTFSEEVSEFYFQEKFTLPNVREGSIIEYEYSLDSPFYYNMNEIEFQRNIPIVYQEVSIQIPEYFKFKPLVKGYLRLNPSHSKVPGQVNITTKYDAGSITVKKTAYSYDKINFMEDKTTYIMSDVPALKEEPYVNSMENYRSAVKYELQYVQFPGQPIENYSTSWEDVVKRIYENERFGKQLRKTNHFRDVLPQLIKPEMDEIQKALTIYSHIQGHMNWNGFLGYITHEGVKKAYKEQSGNIGDINLTLLAMLNEAGLDANPVLVSTRDNGVPMFPTQEGFNYVIAAVTIEGNTVLLDATNKFAEPNILPTRALNWNGKLIDRNGSIKNINLFPALPSLENTIASISVLEDGAIEGQVRISKTQYEAYLHRNRLSNTEEEEYIRDFESKNQDIEVEEYKIVNLDKRGKPVTEVIKYSGANNVTAVGDNLYFRPMFHYGYTENPFKLEERSYPIDFTFTRKDKYRMLIQIPEGYEVISIPENVKLSLPDEVGDFVYQLDVVENSIQLSSEIAINTPIVPAQYYPYVRELFAKIVEKQSEQVVLKKISTDGDSKSTAGGR